MEHKYKVIKKIMCCLGMHKKYNRGGIILKKNGFVKELGIAVKCRRCERVVDYICAEDLKIYESRF